MKQKNKQFLGWIALDIDGTITLDRFSIPEPVVAFLHEKYNEGWKIAIVTGRPASFALVPLKAFGFPHLLLAQNGTIALEMPSKKILFRKYFSVSDLRKIELAYEGVVGDFIIYSGFENQDRIYWRPKRFDTDQAAYIHEISTYTGEKSIAINSFEELPQDSIPLVKCFGTLIEMQRIEKKLQNDTYFHTTLIRDIGENNFHLLLITDRSATKGASLREAISLYGDPKTVIAAGDDENDASLLQAADIKIAMAHAPESLMSVADFIAPPTSQFGIIQALQMAIQKNGK